MEFLFNGLGCHALRKLNFECVVVVFVIVLYLQVFNDLSFHALQFDRL